MGSVCLKGYSNHFAQANKNKHCKDMHHTRKTILLNKNVDLHFCRYLCMGKICIVFASVLVRNVYKKCMATHMNEKRNHRITLLRA